MRTPVLAVALLAGSIPLVAFADDAKRPYEMVWSGRTQDEHPPLVDFESTRKWNVEGVEGSGELTLSDDHQLWGNSVGKLTYRATGDNLRLRVLLAEPIPVTAAFNAVTCWVYGNKFQYSKSSNTSTINITAIFGDKSGREVEVPLRTVDWSEWFLLHRRLDDATAARLGPGSVFKGFKIDGGSNRDDRSIYFDNLAVYTEPVTPLQFEPRPARPFSLPGEPTGTNTGPGKLDFPNRSQTILPDNLDAQSTGIAEKQGAAFVWTYKGTDGTLVYRLDPKTGTWTDITARWQFPGQSAAQLIRPTVGGGVYLTSNGKTVAPERAELLSSDLKDGIATLRWKLTAGSTTQEVTYRFRLWGKSLVVDTISTGGQVGDVRFGKATGLTNARLQTNPFYLYGRNRRPAVVVAGTAEKPLFLTGNSDWYLSNSTSLWADNNESPDGITYNGGSRYTPKTDGKRNDCYDRFFITISPRYEEVLPNIPNPKSPYMKEAGTRIWRTFGSGDRKKDVEYWEDIHRHGMTEIAVVNHETLMRDGEESFTFRTKPAPGKGGDEGELAFSRTMREKFGFLYGPYNNFTDLQPTNEFWSLDMLNRTADNQLQWSWYRSYSPRPARAVEYAAKIPFVLKQKFGYNTAYCDVHTAVGPWDRVDYDPRVPGGGTFAGTFYAFGEILELQKKAWQGPVYSEGGMHAFYSGLTDGNYAQDPSADLPNQPWLVDFDLRKMHPLSINFGMGAPFMFDGSPWPDDPRGRDIRLDRFLAATIAFGHTGFLEYGTQYSLRSYFMLQQLQSRYAVSEAAEIQYADAKGKLWDTSAAVASGTFKRSQIVTRYADGTVTAVNGSRTEPMNVTAYGRKLNLVPNGYAGWTADGKISVLSNEVNGNPVDYAATPAYIYVDGRGQFTRFSQGASKGIGICRILPGNKYEIIPFQGSECGFKIPATSAVALDKAGKELGPANLKWSRGLVFVEPVAGAFSYMVNGGTTATPKSLTSARDRVTPGETVTVQGAQKHQFQIPATAKPGDRIWKQFEGQAIDFTVVAPTITKFKLEGDSLIVSATSNLDQDTTLKVTATAENTVLAKSEVSDSIAFESGASREISLPLGSAPQASNGTLSVSLQAANFTQKFKLALNATSNQVVLLPWPEKGRAGVTLSGQADSFDLGTTGASVEQRPVTAGGVSKPATFTHPAWQNVIGATFVRFDNIALPAQPGVLRAFVGKADGSYPGNGLIYKIAVITKDGKETIVGQTQITKHEWRPIEGDLAPWAGQTVSLKIISDPDGDTSGDWGAWADMKLVSPETKITRTLQSVTGE